MGSKGLNMFNRGMQPTITESVVDSTISVVTSANSTTDSGPNLSRIDFFSYFFSSGFTP